MNNSINIQKNKENAATREVAGVQFTTAVDETTGETTKDVNKLDLTKINIFIFIIC